MRYAFFDENGRVASVHNDDTCADLPAGAIELNESQWESRFNLKLENGSLIDSPFKLQTEELRQNSWAKIKAKRERVKAGGVKVGDKWFHTDDASRIQHMALNMMGASIPANLQWKTMDGTFVTMTQSLAGQVFQAVAVLDMQAFAKAEEHRVAMEASNDPASYDFDAGWPVSFEG